MNTISWTQSAGVSVAVPGDIPVRAVQDGRVDGTLRYQILVHDAFVRVVHVGPVHGDPVDVIPVFEPAPLGILKARSVCRALEDRLTRSL